MPGQHHDSSISGIATIAVPFLAGIISASVVWHLAEKGSSNRSDGIVDDGSTGRRRIGKATKSSSNSLRGRSRVRYEDEVERKKYEDYLGDDDDENDVGEKDYYEDDDENDVGRARKAASEHEPASQVVEHRPSLLRWVSIEDIKLSMEEIRSRIGELPTSFSGRRTRQHWPWDRMNRSRSTSPVDDGRRTKQQQQQQQNDGSNFKGTSSGRGELRGDGNDDEELDDFSDSSDQANPSLPGSPSTSGQSSSEPKSEYCIGSIFGLDVGGTLAKLVYFEQKPEEYESHRTHPYSLRERFYRNRASTHAVLLARRGLTPSSLKTIHDVALAASTGSHDEDDERDAADHDANNKNARIAPGAVSGGIDSTLAGLNENSLPMTSNSLPHLPGAEVAATTEESVKMHSPTTTTGGRKRSSSICLSMVNGTKNAQTHSDSNKGNSASPMHSAASNADLQDLKVLRQESVPDDLDAYADAVHILRGAASSSPPSKANHAGGRNSSIHQPLHHTTESMEDMLDQYNKSVQNNEGCCGESDSDRGKSVREHKMMMNERGHEYHTNHKSSPSTASAATNSMRKSKSMFDFNRGRVEALDRFYSFAHKLDSYREGIKDHKLSFYSRALGGDFHFIRFETRRMQNAMDLIRANNLHLNIREMGATGGGAHKFAQQWDDELGITMKKQEELDSLVAGMQFVLSTVVGECYTFRPNDPANANNDGHSNNLNNPKPNHNDNNLNERNANNTAGDYSRSSSASDYTIGAPIDEDDYSATGSATEHSAATDGPVNAKRQPLHSSSSFDEDSKDRGVGDEWWWSRKVQRDAISDAETYPYMLVTIGTGVSILRVDGPRKHERVSGSTIGGGTYWGLIRLLTDVEDFDDAMRLAERGDASKVDMMVGDIYGEKSNVLEKIGLAADVVASSFGKLVSKEDPASGLKQEDLARALLLMVTINIGQVAYLNAQMYKTSRIYFVGNFLRHNKISQRRLSFAIDYWSKGKMEALFLEHEGYFGALGAFLLSQNIKPNQSGHHRLRSQKSMPASSASSDDDASRGSGRNGLHSRSNSERFPLMSQKSMPASSISTILTTEAVALSEAKAPSPTNITASERRMMYNRRSSS